MSNPNPFFEESLAERDAPVRSALLKELERQQSQVELIASENIVSKAVLEAQGSVLTNKYAEGYPGKRYYGGCEFADQIETLAIERVKQLFNAQFANVQPHSGAQANGAVMLALAKPGDTVLTNFGTVVNPEGIRTIGEFPNLTAAMERAGWSETRIRKIMGENWVRVFKDVWGA